MPMQLVFGINNNIWWRTLGVDSKVIWNSSKDRVCCETDSFEICKINGLSCVTLETFSLLCQWALCSRALFRDHRKSSQKPSETNKIRLGGWGFSKNRTSGFKWCFVYTLVWELKPEVRTFVRFGGREGVSSETNFVRFAGLLRTFAIAPYLEEHPLCGKDRKKFIEDKTAISAHPYSKNTSLIQAKNGESAAFPRSFHPNYCWTRDTPETDNLPLLLFSCQTRVNFAHWPSVAIFIGFLQILALDFGPNTIRFGFLTCW